MRKKKMIVFILFLILALLLGVVFWKEQGHKLERLEDEEFNKDSTISIVVALGLEEEKIHVCIINNSDVSIICDFSYEVQVFQNGKWELYAESNNINAAGIEIPQCSQCTQLVDLNLVESGMYRILKKVGGKAYCSNGITII